MVATSSVLACTDSGGAALDSSPTAETSASSTMSSGHDSTGSSSSSGVDPDGGSSSSSDSTGSESSTGSGASDQCAALVAFAHDLEADDFSGVLRVRRGDGVLLDWASGACIRDPEVDCETDSVFDIGSVTKQFTAAAILALQEDGLLSTNDTLDAHFDGVPLDKADITIHQLLTHSSGLDEALGSDYDEIGRDELVALAFSSALVFEPGSGYVYSNVGYSILSAIIEQITQGSYEAYLAERLLGPAGMSQTGYVLPTYEDGVVAHGYSGDSTMGAPNEQIWAEDGPYWHLRGNGGLLSSAADLHAWDAALLGGKVLSESSLEAMFTPWVDQGFGKEFDTFYGYGWIVLEYPGFGTVVTHSGGNGYFYADVAHLVDADVFVVVLSNEYTPQWETVVTELGVRSVTECD